MRESDPGYRVRMANEVQSTATAEPAGFLEETELLQRVPVCRKTLFNLRRSGKIPSLKLGSRNLYHWPTVEAALLRMQTGGVL